MNVVEAAPTPKTLSFVFPKDSVEANKSSHRNTYQTSWRPANVIYSQ